MKNQIKLGAILSYLSIAVNVITGLIYTPWMINQIGKSDYGLFTLANSLIALFLVDFGLSSATSRYVAKYNAEGRQDKVNTFLGTIYRLYLIVDVVIFIILLLIFFFVDKIYVNLTPQEIEKFKVVYAIAALYSLISFPCITFNGVLTAYEKFIQLKLADLVHRLLIVLLMVIALLCGQGLYALVAVNALSGVITYLYKYLVIRKSTPVKTKYEKTNISLYKEIFGFSLWVTISGLAQRLIFNITPSILGIVANSGAIAVFGIVTTIEQYVFMISTAINGMFLPKISRIYSGTDSEKDIMPLMIKVGKFQFVLNFLIITGFSVLGKDFITLWMGKEYVDAYYGILLVIIPGAFYNSLQIANTAMIVQKKVHIQAGITLIMGVFNVGCSFVLSFFYGVLGACISIFLAYTLRALLYHIAHKKILKLDILYFAKKCYLKTLPAVLFALLFGILLNILIPGRGWFMLVIKGTLLVFAYLLCTVLFTATKSEKEGLFNILKRFKRF